jgi:hypothetical protein
MAALAVQGCDPAVTGSNRIEEWSIIGGIVKLGPPPVSRKGKQKSVLR